MKPVRNYENGDLVLRATFPPSGETAALPNYVLQEHAERNGYSYENREENGLPVTEVYAGGSLRYSVSVTPEGYSVVRMILPENGNTGRKPWNDIIETLSSTKAGTGTTAGASA